MPYATPIDTLRSLAYTPADFFTSEDNPMAHFRYSSTGQWLKGNTHIHSTASDGGKDFRELAEMYAGQGYDFLFRTDHWVVSDVAADRETYPLVWLDGVELHGRDETGAMFHVACLGKVSGLPDDMELLPAMKTAREQGSLLILAHPHWCGNSQDDALRHGFDGVEVYNHVCQWLNGKGEAKPYWTAMLHQDADTLGLAVDDAHLGAEHPGWNGGWIMVAAAERTPEAIFAASRGVSATRHRGRSSTALPTMERGLASRCRPSSSRGLVGPAWTGERVGSFDDRRITSASFDLPADWEYVYLEVEDDRGRRAWTNNLWTNSRMVG